MGTEGTHKCQWGITLEGLWLDLPLYIQWQVNSLVQYILAYTIFFIATFSYVLGQCIYGSQGCRLGQDFIVRIEILNRTNTFWGKCTTNSCSLLLCSLLWDSTSCLNSDAVLWRTFHVGQQWQRLTRRGKAILRLILPRRQLHFPVSGNKSTELSS